MSRMMEAGECRSDEPDGSSAETDHEGVQVISGVLAVPAEPVVKGETRNKATRMAVVQVENSRRDEEGYSSGTEKMIR